jgi:hypothetical protein
LNDLDVGKVRELFARGSISCDGNDFPVGLLLGHNVDQVPANGSSGTKYNDFVDVVGGHGCIVLVCVAVEVLIADAFLFMTILTRKMRGGHIDSNSFECSKESTRNDLCLAG